MKKQIYKNPLFFAFVFPAAFDMVITVLGQDPSYWQNYSLANEASPGFYLLATSPFLFLGSCALWLTLWYFVVKKLPQPFNLTVSLSMLIAHAWGSSSWFNRITLFQDMDLWTVTIIYFILLAMSASYCITLYYKK